MSRFRVKINIYQLLDCQTKLINNFIIFDLLENLTTNKKTTQVTIINKKMKHDENL